MEKIKSFLKTTFLGGFLIVLPIIVLILVLNMFYQFIATNVRPISKLLIEATRLNEFVAAITAVIFILLVFFLVGLAVRTRFGKFTFNLFETGVLSKIPGYKLIRETIAQIFGNQKSLFTSVALVNLFGNETLVTAFITDEHPDGSYTVFVPSGPAPTAGFIYHLKQEYVHKIDYPLDLAMKTILSLGAGSKQLFKSFHKIN